MLDLAQAGFDLVYSSLSFHYVRDRARAPWATRVAS